MVLMNSPMANKQQRVRSAQSSVNFDLSDTEEQQIESNLYQSSLFGTATKLTYSETVRYGTRSNGHGGHLYDTEFRRTSVHMLEHQHSEPNQYDHPIDLSLNDGDRMIRPTASRGSEKPMPPRGIQHIGSRGDEWLRDVIHYEIKPQEQIASERDEIAELPEQELGGDIIDLSTSSIVSRSVAEDLTVQPPSLPKTEAIQQNQRSCIYYAENYVDLFKEKCERRNQEANYRKKLVLQELDEIVKERRACEQVLREAQSKRFVIAPTLFVLEEYPTECDEDSVPELIPLSEDHIRQYDELVHGRPDMVLVSKFNLNVARKDIRTLMDNCWLNDEVINFYMNLLTDRSEHKDTLPSVYAMNTFFVPRLLQGYSNVRRWTRRVDIFSKDIIPVPVHVSNVHWCMAIIHMKNKTIRYYDSMGKPNSEVLHALEKYLQEESLDKRNTPFDTSDFVIESMLNVPHQTNGSDCGVFSCMFAEFITRDKQLTFSQADMEYYRKKMVLEICGGELWN